LEGSAAATSQAEGAAGASNGVAIDEDLFDDDDLELDDDDDAVD